MFALEVYVNGIKVCTAANQTDGTLHAWVNRHQIAVRDSEGANEGTYLNVGGIQGAGMDQEHLRWFSGDLSVGDEVLIKVVDAESVDDPVAVEKVDRNIYNKIAKASGVGDG